MIAASVLPLSYHAQSPPICSSEEDEEEEEEEEVELLVYKETAVKVEEKGGRFVKSVSSLELQEVNGFVELHEVNGFVDFRMCA